MLTAVNGSMHAIEACCDHAVELRGGIHGQAIVGFVVDSEGTVIDARIDESSSGDRELDACIVGIARQWRIPSFAGGPIRISYPFTFFMAGGDGGP